jgi:sporulation protein YlmC with PRC-barrel domain
MKANNLKRIAACIATALCAQMLLAAQQADQSGQKKGTTAQATASSNDSIPVSKLKGADVKSKNGDDLGKLEDMILDRRTGQITFAIVGKGGFGDERHPVPWQGVQINSEKQVTLNVDKQKMQSAPTISSDYSDLNNPDAVIVIYQFYEIVPAGAGAPGETPGGTEQGSGHSQPQPKSDISIPERPVRK